MFPQQVLDDITTGYGYYSALNEGFIADLKKGCNNCLPKHGKCLMGLLISLKNKASVGDFDAESISLYNQMMEIIGGEAYEPVTGGRIYFGSTVTDDPLTLEDILELDYVDWNLGEEMIIPFDMQAYGYPVVAFPVGVILPNRYQNVNFPSDTGDIGAEDDILGVPYEVSGYNVMQGFVNLIVDPLLLTTI